MLCTSHCVLVGTSVQQFNKNGKELKPKYEKPNELFYKATHIYHPCNIWVRESHDNYMWLYHLFIALCDEYTFRYNKIHLCDKKFRELLKIPPTNIPKYKGLTKFALAMPDEYKSNNTIESYRKYYINDKQHIASWKNTKIPYWFTPLKI